MNLEPLDLPVRGFLDWDYMRKTHCRWASLSRAQAECRGGSELSTTIHLSDCSYHVSSYLTPDVPQWFPSHGGQCP